MVEQLGNTVCEVIQDLSNVSPAFQCSDLECCTIDNLGDVNTAGVLSGDVLIYNGTTWVTQAQYEFSCSELATCSVNALVDVDTIGAISGQVLVFDGDNWIPGNQSEFQCTDLDICSIDSLGDVNVPFAVSGDVLVFNGGTWVNVTLPTVTGFSCSDLSGCSISALVDVDTTGTISGDILIYNGSNWVDANTSIITDPLQNQIDNLTNQLNILQNSINIINSKLECFCVSGVAVCCASGGGTDFSFAGTQINTLCTQIGSTLGKLTITDFTIVAPGADINTIDGITGVLVSVPTATVPTAFKSYSPAEVSPLSDTIQLAAGMKEALQNGDPGTITFYVQFTDLSSNVHIASITADLFAWDEFVDICSNNLPTTYVIDEI